MTNRFCVFFNIKAYTNKRGSRRKSKAWNERLLKECIPNDSKFENTVSITFLPFPNKRLSTLSVLAKFFLIGVVSVIPTLACLFFNSCSNTFYRQ